MPQKCGFEYGFILALFSPACQYFSIKASFFGSITQNKALFFYMENRTDFLEFLSQAYWEEINSNNLISRTPNSIPLVIAREGNIIRHPLFPPWRLLSLILLFWGTERHEVWFFRFRIAEALDITGLLIYHIWKTVSKMILWPLIWLQYISILKTLITFILMLKINIRV